MLANDKVLSQKLDAYPKKINHDEQQQAMDDIFKHFNRSYYGVPIAYQMKHL